MSFSLLYERSIKTFVVALSVVSLNLVTFCDSVIATPVTVIFDAEIIGVSPGIPFDSGLNFAVGDTVSGMFQFHPEVSGGSFLEVVEPFSAKLLVDGITLMTPATVSDLTLRSRNNVFVADFPPASVVDLIEVGSTLGPANPGELPNVAPDESSFRIDLWGNDSILDTARLPAEQSTWNSFLIKRDLGVSIRDGIGGVVGFIATVQEVNLVPEPSTLLIAPTFLAITILRRSRSVCR